MGPNRKPPVLSHHLKLEQGAVPDTWPDVTAFAEWYLSAGMPMMIPSDYEIFLSDDASAMCLFRKGQFQVELYMVYPGPLVPIHEHPDVEVIKYYSGTFDHIEGGRFVRQRKAEGRPVLKKGEAHGAGFQLQGEKGGFALFAFQHWAPDLKPCTVAARWKGKTVGPKQEALIRRFYPDAYVVEGYADVTRRMSDPEGFAYRSSGAIPVSQL
ncbi:hypothetical protein [Quisquiliibacterium transsilvanicum]|uniref:Cupin domain-containing protein n=1 Tax=Quisquiliibacterium transsilvanicum TaxID=1549638 RepID=A0A7W8HG95_9BURK|nr:hypothetical protein [Quisquiliibacterium transsilvanicum]MBB5271547.1 hypothetical protein [Quisquiliibacterium transsilvanicum]